MSEPKQPNMFTPIVEFVRSIFVLDHINYKQSIDDIKGDVSFKGINIWILISSILVCSLGLNMDSTAVVIGAMLISPLMGPIVGLGLGLGIFDRKLIFRSIKNLGVATAISILTAFIFFYITPTEAVPEILARTRPTILDLFVAFFGGLAGILAASKSLKSNVVPGVAIATALMPPLCTAGFGLAIGNWDYFAGALYLFLMNCIMISLAALLLVLYLRYPKFAFVDRATMKRIRNSIGIIVIVVAIPSVIFYYNLLEENLLQDRVNSFVQQEIASQPGLYITNQEMVETDSAVLVKLNINGEFLEEDERQALELKMQEEYDLKICKLQISQPQPVGFKEHRLATLKSDIIKELYTNSATNLQTKDDEIAFLKAEIQKLSGATMVSEKLTKLAKSQFDISEMAVGYMIFNAGEAQDTLPTAVVRWSPGLSTAQREDQTGKLEKLMRIQLETQSARIVAY